MLHHVEIWVPNLTRAIESWGWLLGELGYVPHQTWPAGRSWRHNDTYLVFERSPALTGPHDRHRAGLNHLAFTIADRPTVAPTGATTTAGSCCSLTGTPSQAARSTTPRT